MPSRLALFSRISCSSLLYLSGWNASCRQMVARFIPVESMPAKIKSLHCAFTTVGIRPRAINLPGCTSLHFLSCRFYQPTSRPLPWTAVFCHRKQVCQIATLPIQTLAWEDRRFSHSNKSIEKQTDAQSFCLVGYTIIILLEEMS